MQRVWTDESRDAWVERRIEWRKRKRQESDPRHPRPESLERERHGVRDNLISLATKTFSWQVKARPISLIRLLSLTRALLGAEAPGGIVSRTLLWDSPSPTSTSRR